MGLFDDIRCEMPLPVRWATRGDRFQTKCLGCEMDRYVIRRDGSLLREGGHWGGGRVPDMVIPFHGDVEFHDYDRQRGWISLIARFTEGSCVRIWLDEWHAPHDKPDAEPPAPVGEQPQAENAKRSSPDRGADAVTAYGPAGAPSNPLQDKD